ncbi:hypothetical protein RhiJN_17026 [Ceratobasidium sp. AG-Ba]|nr:hypothetical protein RhiJN_17026 [Ceratobasidium sp. AG-Ba]
MGACLKLVVVRKHQLGAVIFSLHAIPLEYNVKREYTIPGLTAYISVVSVVSIVALAVLNVVLQGYDIVTVLRPDPNVTEHYWWSTRGLSVRSAGECSPVSLPRKSAIATNSSLFSYELSGLFGANKKEITGASSYMANPLRSCTVDGIIANIDLAQLLFQFESRASIFALTYIEALIEQRQFIFDDVVAYYLQGRPSSEGLDDKGRLIQRNASSLLNVIAILDAFGADYTVALSLTRDATVGDTPNIIATGGLLSCPGGQNTTCQSKDMNMVAPQCAASYPNGTTFTWRGVCPYLAPVETNLLNMFTVL